MCHSLVAYLTPSDSKPSRDLTLVDVSARAPATDMSEHDEGLVEKHPSRHTWSGYLSNIGNHYQCSNEVAFVPCLCTFNCFGSKNYFQARPSNGDHYLSTDSEQTDTPMYIPAWDATTRKLLLSFLDTDFLKIHKTRGIDIQQKPLAIHTVGVFASCGLQEKEQMLVLRRQMVVATYR